MSTYYPTGSNYKSIQCEYPSVFRPLRESRAFEICMLVADCRGEAHQLGFIAKGNDHPGRGVGRKGRISQTRANGIQKEPCQQEARENLMHFFAKRKCFTSNLRLKSQKLLSHCFLNTIAYSLSNVELDYSP